MIKTKAGKHISKKFVLRLVAILVLINGLVILYGSLLSHLALRHSAQTEDFRLSIDIVSGMSLVYLSTLLYRRKQRAWVITLSIYSLLVLFHSVLLIRYFAERGDLKLINLLHGILVPLFISLILIKYRSSFTVKSDSRSFTLSLRFIAIALAIAFVYGVTGLQLLDHNDFHQEINLVQAAHYTIDQFGVTTGKELKPYTKRAEVFLYSLSLISVTSLAYAAISIFQPIRARFTDQTLNQELMRALLERNGGDSEDYFKIWPHDKNYIFTDNFQAGLAYRVEKGVAMVVADPAGDPALADELISKFLELCATNDWLPSFIHTEEKWTSFYLRHKFSVQKLGQEAIVDTTKFMNTTYKDKYFRQIENKFERLGYQTELLSPPHDQAIISRIARISSDWLSLPGRAERGFLLGYYSDNYMQSCNLLIARDSAGTIQAFLNVIPSYDKAEATYDLLRYSKEAVSNTNDFLLIRFITSLHEAGTPRLNMGLAPLTGLVKTENDSLTNTLLRFIYSNGDRFYSFSGLLKFKQKYEPNWQDRYIAYRGGLRGFARTLNALNLTMSRSYKHRSKS